MARPQTCLALELDASAHDDLAHLSRGSAGGDGLQLLARAALVLGERTLVAQHTGPTGRPTASKGRCAIAHRVQIDEGMPADGDI